MTPTANPRSTERTFDPRRTDRPPNDLVAAPAPRTPTRIAAEASRGNPHAYRGDALVSEQLAKAQPRGEGCDRRAVRCRHAGHGSYLASGPALAGSSADGGGGLRDRAPGLRHPAHC